MKQFILKIYYFFKKKLKYKNSKMGLVWAHIKDTTKKS